MNADLGAGDLQNLLLKATELSEGAISKCSFIKELAGYLLSNIDTLPGDERARLSDAIKGSQPRRSRQSEAVAAIRKTSRSDFKLSGNIGNQFISWEQSDGISFWDGCTYIDGRQNYGDIVSSLYYKIREAGAIFKIFRRFSTVGLCVLAEEVARKRGLKRVVPLILEHLVDLIQKGKNGSGSEDTIITNLQSDITAGRKYRGYGEELGGLGILFHLPESVPDYIWEQRLPSGGDNFGLAMIYLRGAGICDEAKESGSHRVAEKIISAITKGYEIPAIEFANVSPERPIKLRKRRRILSVRDTSHQVGNDLLLMPPNMPISSPQNQSTSLTISHLPNRIDEPYSRQTSS
ncbi:MAG: hypothetical protein M1840_000631 [Geoglossum simile]|nr:MAG: hypothetical protein M1840_000631 [Geoglossum simile]